MPIIKDATISELRDSYDFGVSLDEAFTTFYPQGGNSRAPYAGIYQCTACGREMGIALDHEMPPCNNVDKHASLVDMKPEWRLVVAARETHAPSEIAPIPLPFK